MSILGMKMLKEWWHMIAVLHNYDVHFVQRIYESAVGNSA